MMTEQPIRHTINELLVGMFNYILFLEERNLKQRGVSLTMTEVHLLESIEKSSDNTMSHIARRSMISLGTLSIHVKKLMHKGLVVKVPDQQDGRIVRLELTGEARKILAVHDAFHEEMIDKAVGRLGLEENLVLKETLTNLLDYFAQEYAAASDEL